MADSVKTSIRNQIIAANPDVSAWVGANAGSGKTRVLTNRVARLLLAEAKPANILCITYTKAAAAEMAARLSTLLGGWALADNEELSKSLCELEGLAPGSRTYSPDALSQARRLFARALETPGGLKIQTIHAFCETILKRFPLEAGVPPGFDILEDEDSKALIEASLDDVARSARENPDLDLAFETLGQRYAPSVLRTTLESAVRGRQNYERCLNFYGTVDAVIDALAQISKTDRAIKRAELAKQLANFVTDATATHWANALRDGGVKVKKRADILEHYRQSSDEDERRSLLTQCFITAEGTPVKHLTDNPVKAAHPGLDFTLTQAQSEFYALTDQYKSVLILEDTNHFLYLVKALLQAYHHRKTLRSALDFDDLIIRTHGLFANADHAAQWVMYKLDQGLDHILIDETQDTSPAQWRVIESPLKEFFQGASAKQEPRTFFAVGDQKQSIYSFQGADASLFDEKKLELGKQIEASAPFKNVPLTLSFRSAAPVLNFVDAAFSNPETMEGLGEADALTHGIFREGHGGLVELWPYVPKPEQEKSEPWDTPLDSVAASNPVVSLCDHVAKTIAGWLSDPTAQLSAHGRQITPGDIIILVQSRGPAFRQMIKSLTAHEVPVAGADRLRLLEDIAILDLLSYARCALLGTDDLSLAEVLKSPFFGVEENILYDLAYNRKGSLWSSLKRSAATNTHHAQIVTAIEIARTIGLREGPYSFFTHLLDSGQPSGRHRLFSRLGTACRDSLDAFIRECLGFEQNNPRSLQGFVTWFENNAGEIKRELDQESASVRIMTVHGAKGLEGNIVFLLDACNKPNLSKGGPVRWIDPDPEKYGTEPYSGEPIPAIIPAAQAANDAVNDAKEIDKRRKYEEYRRLFYVAATRACDRLYICGAYGSSKPDLTKTGFTPTYASWYELAMLGFDTLGENNNAVSTLKSFPWEGEGKRLIHDQTAEVKRVDDSASYPHDKDETTPPWMHTPAAQERSVNALSPSLLADRIESADHVDDIPPPDQATPNEASLEPAAFAPTGLADRFERGRILHRLLELLPEQPTEARADLADHWLEHHANHIPPSVRLAWRDEVMTVLETPAFAPVFGPGSRAEVSVGGRPPGLKPGTMITGQIDRLVVTPTQVLIVDYKTNQPPPTHEDDVAPAYLAQMAAYRSLITALYPTKTIKAALLWTWDAHLMALSDKTLDHAFARFLASP